MTGERNYDVWKVIIIIVIIIRLFKREKTVSVAKLNVP